MTRRDNLSALLAIDDAVGKLVATRERGRVAFGNSLDAQDATVQRLTSIAASVSTLPKAFRKQHPQIRWEALEHLTSELFSYNRLDVELFWNFLTSDLPALEAVVSAELVRLRPPASAG